MSARKLVTITALAVACSACAGSRARERWAANHGTKYRVVILNTCARSARFYTDETHVRRLGSIDLTSPTGTGEAYTASLTTGRYNFYMVPVGSNAEQRFVVEVRNNTTVRACS
jgi:hypothetical protein